MVGILNVTVKRAGYGAGSGTVSMWYGSADPDPNQNVTNKEHCGLCAENCKILNENFKMVYIYGNISYIKTLGEH